MQTAKAYVETIRQEIENSRSSRLWRDSINMLSTVSESIFSRSAHFILELLQNAEDADPKNAPAGGKIEFAISQSRIRVGHNGAPFTETNVDAICGVRSTKKPELGTLGFLGIGFKSVFKITDCPQVHSGDFHFKFDKGAHKDSANVPWQIIPVWLDTSSEPIDPGVTTFVLPFRSTDLYQQTLADLKKLDVHVFLFLRWLKQLKIVDELSGQTVLIENLGENNGIVTIKKNAATHRFAVFRRSAPVPPEVANDPVLDFYKRQHVTQREIVIAFAVDDAGDLQTIEEASALGSVSSFLPLVEERSGAKFLIQADFLVQPGREAIQYELAWNHWLLGEAVELAKQAIEKFKAHPRWESQFLPLFNFNSYSGQAAFDKLFGPRLRTPIIKHLQVSEVFPIANGGHARPESVVLPEQGLEGLLTDADLPSLFPGQKNLHLADPSIDEKTLPTELKQSLKRLELGEVARCWLLLKSKSKQSSHTDWFQKLYQAMAETTKPFKETRRTDKRGHFIYAEDPILVLTESNEIVYAKEAHLRKIPEKVLALREKFHEVDSLMRRYEFIHPCLDSSGLNQFFKEKTHLQMIDYDKICRDVFLPKVRVDAPTPPKDELIAYTRLLQKGPTFSEHIWVLTKTGDIKPSNQMFMGTAYSPAEDWGKNARYSPQIDFLSSDYLQGVTAEDLPGWKDFFSNAGVKNLGERNHVEIFAMAFVEDKLSSELDSFVAKDSQQVGYDREARRRQDGALVKIEIKGRKKDEPVQLVGNEPQAAQTARNNGELFWVCIVPGIPENPQLWVVEDALKAGTSDTLKIDVAQWRAYGRRVA